jgi:hypothetical protein
LFQKNIMSRLSEAHHYTFLLTYFLYNTPHTFSSKYILSEELIDNFICAPSTKEIVLKLKFNKLVYVYFIILLTQFVM